LKYFPFLNLPEGGAVFITFHEAVFGITKTRPQPPLRIYGTTSFINSSWRKWTCKSSAKDSCNLSVKIKSFYINKTLTIETQMFFSNLSKLQKAWFASSFEQR
jgi:hypothetical protein